MRFIKVLFYCFDNIKGTRFWVGCQQSLITKNRRNGSDCFHFCKVALQLRPNHRSVHNTGGGFGKAAEFHAESYNGSDKFIKLSVCANANGGHTIKPAVKDSDPTVFVRSHIIGAVAAADITAIVYGAFH
jgi:hypothetical protein